MAISRKDLGEHHFSLNLLRYALVSHTASRIIWLVYPHSLSYHPIIFTRSLPTTLVMAKSTTVALGSMIMSEETRGISETPRTPQYRSLSASSRKIEFISSTVVSRSVRQRSRFPTQISRTSCSRMTSIQGICSRTGKNSA